MSIWVLFDLDGTLVDNSEGITKSTQFALDSYGYPAAPKFKTAKAGAETDDDTDDERYTGSDETQQEAQ